MYVTVNEFFLVALYIFIKVCFTAAHYNIGIIIMYLVFLKIQNWFIIIILLLKGIAWPKISRKVLMKKK